MRGFFYLHRLTLLLAFLGAMPAFGITLGPSVGTTLDFTTVDGRAFKHAVVRRIDPLGLTVETADGFEKLPYSKLPPDLAAHFDFTDEEIARYQAKLRADQQALAARQAADAAAAQKAAQDKAAAALAAEQARKARATPVPTEAPMGTRGATRLGAPQLGARGTAK